MPDRKLENPVTLNFHLVLQGADVELKTLWQLQEFIFECVKRRLKQVGPLHCVQLEWVCRGITEQEVRSVVVDLKKRLKVLTLVSKREEGCIKKVLFVNELGCKNCDIRVDCLSSERLT